MKLTTFSSFDDGIVEEEEDSEGTVLCPKQEDCFFRCGCFSSSSLVYRSEPSATGEATRLPFRNDDMTAESSTTTNYFSARGPETDDVLDVVITSNHDWHDDKEFVLSFRSRSQSESVSSRVQSSYVSLCGSRMQSLHDPLCGSMTESPICPIVGPLILSALTVRKYKVQLTELEKKGFFVPKIVGDGEASKGELMISEDRYVLANPSDWDDIIFNLWRIFGLNLVPSILSNNMTVYDLYENVYATTLHPNLCFVYTVECDCNVKPCNQCITKIAEKKGVGNDDRTIEGMFKRLRYGPIEIRDGIRHYEHPDCVNFQIRCLDEFVICKTCHEEIKRDENGEPVPILEGAEGMELVSDLTKICIEYGYYR